jgi:hypothetical protein
MAHAKTLQARIESDVQMEPTSGCWLWVGSLNSCGYGSIKWKNKTHIAHRVFYAELVSPIPEGLFVCHRCDNRVCVNPHHLFLGTAKDNSDDRVRKGRSGWGFGSKSANSKLTEADIPIIRELDSRGVGLREIAKRFGVHYFTIWSVLTGRRWKHVITNHPTRSRRRCR